MQTHSLGRKRILDTQLASILHLSEVTSLITNNHADFRIFGCFDLVGYRGTGG